MGIKVVRPPGRKDWYLSICHKGKRMLRHVGSREAAFAARKEIETALASGEFVPPKAKDAAKEMTFKEAFAKWQKEHVEVRLKPSTQRYYESIGDGWLVPMFGDQEVVSIMRSDVKAVITRWKELRENPPEIAVEPEDGKPKKRKHAPRKGLRTIPNALRTLRSFYAWAIEEGIASKNPASDPSKLFKVDMPFRGDYLRPEEVSPYLEGVRKKAPRYFSILRTMIFTGLRVGEALGLEWGDVDAHGGFLNVRRSRWREHVTSPKTLGSIRRVNLSPETMEVLRAYRAVIAESSLKAGRPMPETVFVNEAGKPMDASKVSKAHELGLKEAGLRHIRIHDLRGTFTALLVSAGVPIYHVSKVLGHTSIETTMRHYANLAPGAAKEMPNVLERFVFGDPAENHVNRTQTTGVAAEVSKYGGA
jgi:integrase